MSSITNDPSAFFDSLENGEASPPKRENAYDALISGKLEKESEPAQVTAKDNPAAFFDSLQKEDAANSQPKDASQPSAFDQILIASKGAALDSETKKWLDLEDDPERLKQIKQQAPWVPLSDEQHRTLYDNMRQQPLVGSLWDTAKEAASSVGQTLWTGAKAIGKIGRDLALSTSEARNDPYFQQHPEVAPNPDVPKDIKDLMSAYPAMGRDVIRTKREIDAGGTDATDRLAEKLGIHGYDDSFKNYLARERLKEHDAAYDVNNPSTWGQFVNYATYRPALAAIARYAGPDKEAIKHEFPGISDEQARAIQDKRANDAAEQSVQDVVRQENESPEDQGLQTLGSFILPSGNLFSVGGEAIGAAGSGISALKAIGKTPEEINAAIKASMEGENPVGPIGRAMQAVGNAGGAVDRFGQKINQATEKALSYVPEPARPFVARHLPLAGVGAAAGAYEAEQDPGDLGSKALSFLKGFGAAEIGARIPRALEDIGKGSELIAGGSTGTFKATALNPESAPFTKTLLKATSAGNPAVLDWIGNNAKDYAKTGVQMLPLAVAMGVAQSADPHEMGQILSQGLIYTMGGQFLHKAVSSDPITNQRVRAQKFADIQKTLSGMYPESQANIAHAMSWDNVIDASAKRLDEAHQAYVEAIQKHPEGSPEVNEAAQALANASRIHEMNQRANPQTRQEYAVQAAQSVADGAQLVNGPLRAGKNVRIEALTTDQIAQKLMEANAGKITPEEAQQAAQTGAGAFFSRHSENRLIDPFKDAVIVNMDHVLTRQQMGEAFNNAFHHELGHALEAIPEWRDINAGTREQLFGTEHRDANGNLLAATPGIFDQKKLVDAFNNTYAQGLKNGVTPQQLAERLGLWDHVNNRLDEAATAKYMQEELLADINSHGISSYAGKGFNPVLDWAITKQANNRVARAVHKVLGLGGGDAFKSSETGLVVSPEVLAAKRNAVRELKKLNGELSSSVPLKGASGDFAKKFGMKERKGDTVSRAEMMANKALLEHYGKDSGLFKTEMQAIVTDSNGTPVGMPIKIANPLATEGSWRHETDDNGNPKIVQTRGYGQIPDEIQGLTIPPGGQVHVERQFVYQPDGQTPILNSPKEVKALIKTRGELIRDAVDNTPDAGAPNRFRAVSADGLTYRGTLTPLQIKAIQALPEGIVPRSIKEKIITLNEAIARNDGSRFIGDYASRIDKNGRYVPFASKHIDFIPVGMHFSKDGHFLVTTVSVSRMFDKLAAWRDRFPARLAPWHGDAEEFFNEMVEKYLKNWQEGRRGAEGLDPDPQVAQTKANIFNDFLNIYDSATEGSNPDRTRLPKKQGRLTKAERDDEKSSDANTIVRSRRLDAFADLIPHAGPKIPIDYEKAKINWMPARELDEEYKKAVDAGDTESAQRLTDEAAKRAGYTVKAYHGTNKNFRIFKPQFGRALWFSEDRGEIERGESGAQGIKKIMPVYLNPGRVAGRKEYDNLTEGQLLRDFDSANLEGTRVVFDPSRIKSAEPITKSGGQVIPLSQRFNPSSSDIRYSPAKKEYPTSEEGLYSNLQKTIDEKVQGKFASPAQLKALINNPQSGIKPDEIKWTGVNDAIDRIASENGGKVPKDAVMEYLRNDGAVKLEPVTRKDTYYLEVQPKHGEPYKEGTFSSKEEAKDYAQAFGIDDFTVEEDEPETQYKAYSLPSGTNYQEKVLTMPSKTMDEISRSLGYGPYSSFLTPEQDAAVNRAYDSQRARANEYQSSHFRDIPNYVAHIRESDHVIDGKPGRVIEELQSDRAQSARKQGYIDPEKQEEMKRLSGIERDLSNEIMALKRHLLTEAIDVRESPEYQDIQRKIQENSDAIRALNESGGATGIPDHPFRRDWPTQLLKRSLIDAVKDGKKWLGWVGGEEQADRYDLSKQIDSVEAELTAPDNYRIIAYKNGQAVVDTGASAMELPNTVGKDLAKKIIEHKGGSFGGLDLKVGGEGMTGFYDQILPTEAKKFLKKIDPSATLEQTEIPKESGEGFGFGGKPRKGDVPMVKIWKFNITPEIERVVKSQGLPQFSPARKSTPSPADDAIAKAMKVLEEMKENNNVLHVASPPEKEAPAFMPARNMPTPPVQHESEHKEGSVGGILNLVHFSGSYITKANPKKMGKGAATPSDMRGANKTFFYLNRKGYEEDIASRANAYVARVDGNSLYDYDNDPLNVRAIVNAESRDKAIKRAGFVGYFTKKNKARPFDAVAMFEPTDLTPAEPTDIYSKAEAKRRTPKQEPEIDYQAQHDAWEAKIAAGGPLYAPARTGNEDIAKISEEYAKSAGLPYRPHSIAIPVHEETAKKIADFYDAAKDDPSNPEVHSAYKALANEVVNQWRAFERAGYVAEPWTKKGQPYTNSQEMMDDVRDNKHIYYFKTEGGFGQGGITDKMRSENPMLGRSGVNYGSEKDVPVNDVFRVVHDIVGHGAHGYEFGPKGEFNAYLEHSRMFSDKAKPALAAETLAQNSWVNYGPHLRRPDGSIPKKGELGYIAPADRKFADQKNIVIPGDILKSVDDYASDQAPRYTPARSQATFDDFTDPEKVKGIASKRGWAILTAENPNNKAATPQVNAKLNATLKDQLDEEGLPYKEITGSYGSGQEHGFLVVSPSMDYERAKELAKKYNQESVLTPHGYVYQDGSIRPPVGATIAKPSDEDDYYSSVDGNKFAMDFGDFSDAGKFGPESEEVKKVRAEYNAVPMPDGTVRVRDEGEPFRLTPEITTHFTPARHVDLEDYADRTVIALPADRMGIGAAFVGPTGAKKRLSVDTQGGRGFMYLFNGGGWAFASEHAAKTFLKRIKTVSGDKESALVGITAMNPFNHLKNQTGLTAYVEALKAALDSKHIDLKQANAHVKSISRAIVQSKDQSLWDSNKETFRHIKTLSDLQNAVASKKMTFGDATPFLQQIQRKTHPISERQAREIGISPEDVARDIGDKEIMDVPFGTVVDLLEIPHNQKPEQSDFHHSYPWVIHGKRIGYLNGQHNVGDLSSDPRIKNKAGQVTAQPLQTVLPVLDKIPTSK